MTVSLWGSDQSVLVCFEAANETDEKRKMKRKVVIAL